MDENIVTDEMQDEVPIEQPNEETQKADHEEKMLPASYVSKLIQKAKLDGAKKMQKQVEALEQQLNQQQGEQPQAEMQQPQAQGQMGGQNVGMGGMQQQDPEAIRQMIMQQIQSELKQRQESEQHERMQREIEQVAQQYHGKMMQGKELFDDFEAVTSDFDPSAFPQLVYLANQADNTAAIIYELKKNPTKLATLATLVERSPQLARGEIGKLSQSIKTNQEAIANEPNVNEPLDRMKPSNLGADKPIRSVRDFKNASFLKA